MSPGTDISSWESRRGEKDSLLRVLGSSRGSSSTPKLSSPHNNFHNFYSSFNMPYAVTSNSFRQTHGIGSVHRRPSSHRLAGNPVPADRYPSIVGMVEWAQKEDGVRSVRKISSTDCLQIIPLQNLDSRLQLSFKSQLHTRLNPLLILFIS